MSMAGKLLCFTLVIGLASAAVWQGRPPKKPKEFAHKEGCYVEEVNDVIPYGVTINPIGNCVRIHCSESMLDYASCGVMLSGDPKCYKTETDLSVGYPDCCPHIKCDLDNNLI